MTDLLVVYVTCESVLEAKKIATHLLEKKLCACVNILDGMQSLYFWPSSANSVQEGSETVLLLKSSKQKWEALEGEIRKIHSYEVPCIMAFDVARASENYEKWIKDRLG